MPCKGSSPYAQTQSSSAHRVDASAVARRERRLVPSHCGVRALQRLQRGLDGQKALARLLPPHGLSLRRRGARSGKRHLGQQEAACSDGTPCAVGPQGGRAGRARCECARGACSHTAAEQRHLPTHAQCARWAGGAGPLPPMLPPTRCLPSLGMLWSLGTLRSQGMLSTLGMLRSQGR